MKKVNATFAVLFLLAALLSCNGSSTETNQSSKNKEDTSEATSASENPACYYMTNGKDTISMKITGNNNIISGELMYHYYEKDRNYGTINGRMSGDTIFATYTFMSEGVTSSREVVFLKKGDEIIEGYGEVDPTTGKPDFSNSPAIKFDNNFILKKTDCR